MVLFLWAFLVWLARPWLWQSSSFHCWSRSVQGVHSYFWIFYQWFVWSAYRQATSSRVSIDLFHPAFPRAYAPSHTWSMAICNISKVESWTPPHFTALFVSSLRQSTNLAKLWSFSESDVVPSLLSPFFYFVLWSRYLSIYSPVLFGLTSP